MIPVLFRLWLAQIRQNLTKLLITLLGITIGTSGFISIRLANDSAFRSMQESVTILRGGAPLILRADSGEVPESIVPLLESESEIGSIAPQMVRYYPAQRNGADLGLVQVLGVDLLQFPASGAHAGVFKKLFADRYSALASKELKSGGLSLRIDGRREAVKIAAELPATGPLASYSGRVLLFDIAVLQDLTKHFGTIDSIGVFPKQESEIEKVKERLKRILPAGVSVDEPEGLENEAAHATEALRLNLDFLASLSLVVSALLIYNSVSFLMLQRRREFGILRALGARTGRLQAMLLGEAALLGLIAGTLGIIAARFGSSRLIEQVSRTVSSLYAPIAPRGPAITLSLMLETLLLGVAVSLAGALLPVREASKRPIRELFFPQTYETAPGRNGVLLSAAGICLLALSFVVPSFGFLNYSLYLGFLPPILMTFGWLCLGPGLGALFIRLLSYISKRSRSALAELAAAQLSTALRRVSATMTAVGIALGLFLGVSTMISSFRETVSQWLDQILKADLYISASDSIAAGSRSALPSEVADWLAVQPDVGNVDLIRHRSIRLNGQKTLIYGVRFDIITRENRLVFLSPPAQSLSEDSTGALVSESFERRFGKQREIEIPGIAGIRKIPVLGVFADYSSDRGLIYVPPNVFHDLFNHDEPQGISIYLKNPESAERIKAQLLENFKELAFTVRSNGQLREEILKVFDQTFVVTYALRLIALIISLFVIINTVLMLSVERERDHGILWAIGLRQRTITKLLAFDSLMLGAGGAFFGMLQGFTLSLILVYFVNRFFFGWSIALHLSPWVYGLTSLAVLGLALLVGWIAAAFRSPALEVLRYE